MSGVKIPAMSKHLPLSPVELVSVILVTAGLVLGATVDMGFLVLFAAGAFGPVLLRELGLLSDRDELQRELSLRAGRRAYLAGGLFLAAVTIAKTWGTASLDHDEISASAALACLVVVYFLSYLTEFWGPQAAASRILLAFGTLWLVFILLSHGGEALKGEVVGFLAELALVAPFFALAFACRRWPRVSGVLLVLVGLALFVLFKIWRAFDGNSSSIIVGLTFVLPALYTGVALAGSGRTRDDRAA